MLNHRTLRRNPGTDLTSGPEASRFRREGPPPSFEEHRTILGLSREPQCRSKAEDRRHMPKYTKGRDLYDLVWYLSDRNWPEPNVEFLQAALDQTGWKGPAIDSSNWRRLLWSHLEPIAWGRAIEDVRPFLERQADAALLTPQ